MASRNPDDPSTSWHYGPSQTALFLLDFHKMFVEKAGGPNANAAAQVASELLEWANSKGITIVHGLVDINQEPFVTCKNAGKLKGIIKAMGEEGGEEYGPLVASTLKSDKNVTFLRTPGLTSALSSPGLLEYLKRNDIRSVVMCGLSTSGCVLRTAVAATDAKLITTVISDACSDPDQDVHDLLINKILLNRAFVSTAADFKTAFESTF